MSETTDRMFVIIFLLFFLAFITFALYEIKTSKTEGKKCLDAPINYGIQQYSKDINGKMTCICSMMNNSKSQNFIVDNESFNPTNNIINFYGEKDVYYFDSESNKTYLGQGYNNFSLPIN